MTCTDIILVHELVSKRGWGDQQTRCSSCVLFLQSWFNLFNESLFVGWTVLVFTTAHCSTWLLSE